MAQPQNTEPIGMNILVTELMESVAALVRKEITLAKHELEYEIGNIFKLVLWCGIAAVLAMIGLIVIAATFVLILFEYTGLPAWSCAAIVSVILLAGVGGLLLAGRGIAKSIHVTPVRTFRTIVGDIKWMAEWLRTRFA
jgi:uncharacterized membrane protein YqjE